MITAESIIIAAEACLGTPYRHQGRVVGVGLDCAGVLQHILSIHGLPYTDERGYPRMPYDGQLSKILKSQPSLIEIEKRSAGPGDVLEMRITRAPQHIAIHAGYYHGQTLIIHSTSDTGRVVVQIIDDAMRARIVNAYRIVGML